VAASRVDERVGVLLRRPSEPGHAPAPCRGCPLTSERRSQQDKRRGSLRVRDRKIDRQTAPDRASDQDHAPLDALPSQHILQLGNPIDGLGRTVIAHHHT
jgi:hypothetical protein